MKPSIRWPLVAATILAGVGLAAVYLARLSAPPPPAAACRQDLEIVDDDGTALPAALYRCRAVRGRQPALLVWADSPHRARLAVIAFDAWTREGRSLWVIDTPPRPEVLDRQVRAALEALAEDPWVDRDRITMVAGASLLALTAAPPGGVRLRVLLEGQSDTARQGNVAVIAGGWNARTLARLAEDLRPSALN
ncbi:MAG TPA: hypothetical protein ENK10_03285 [Acidobacteria bacterium]|nr:hypothetical protein [Acidobacteriota bacterium]